MADPGFTIADATQGLDWEAVLDAFYDWITASCPDVPDGSIAWVNQGLNRPVGVVVSLTITAVNPVGIDAQLATYDAGGANGQEITHLVYGPRTCTLRVQHFGGAAAGDLASSAALARAASRLRLPSSVEGFTAAGVGILSFGPVTDTSAVRALQIEPRAMLDVRFTVTDSASEKGGYIATAQVDVTVTPTQ